ncbi:MAG: hypothetical protein ACYC61_03765 [Isosphaeraceae bacterium]
MGPAEPPASPVGIAPSLGRRFRLLLVVLVLARGITELGVMPPFEGWDEYQHVGHVVHVLETGRRATLGVTDVPQSLLTAMSAFPQPRVALRQMGTHPAASGYAEFWARQANGDGAAALGAPGEAPSSIRLYQAQHSWWYYRIMAPLFAAAGGVSDLRSSVAALRLVNLLFTAAAVWVALGVIAVRIRSRSAAAWIGLALAVHPLFLMNGARVSSDAPGIFLATLTVAVALGLDARISVGRSLALGALAGAAILAKATNWSLVPFLASCWLFAVMRGRRLGRGLVSYRLAAGAGLTMAMGLAIVVGPEVLHNLAAYGVPTPMQEAVLNRQRGRGLIDLARTAMSVAWLAEAGNLWLRDTFLAGGWSFVGGSIPVRPLYSWAAIAGLLGWGWRMAAVARARRLGRRVDSSATHAPSRAIFDSAWTPAACVLLCASITAALGYHVVQSRLAWGQATTGPWYASAGLPWFLALLIAGAMSGPSRRIGAAIALVLVGSCVLGEQTLLWTRMLPAYSGGATGWEALRRIGQLQPGWLGPATALAATVAAGLLLLAALATIACIPATTPAELPAPASAPVPPAPRGPHRPARPVAVPGDSARGRTVSSGGYQVVGGDSGRPSPDSLSRTQE